MKTVIIDNYDSFTYNLVHLLKELDTEVDVLRNDCFALQDLAAYDRIVLSPGPGIPREAGLMPEVIRTYAGQKPILGICLGHQAIGEAFGAKLCNLKNVFHGVQTPIRLREKEGIFKELPEEILVGRYHSWVIEKNGLPESLAITATDEEGHIMAIRHKHLDINGLQFHPESILTPQGRQILRNWLSADTLSKRRSEEA